MCRSDLKFDLWAVLEEIVPLHAQGLGFKGFGVESVVKFRG
jgi:hypothetical protein